MNPQTHPSNNPTPVENTKKTFTHFQKHAAKWMAGDTANFEEDAADLFANQFKFIVNGVVAMDRHTLRDRLVYLTRGVTCYKTRHEHDSTVCDRVVWWHFEWSYNGQLYEGMARLILNHEFKFVIFNEVLSPKGLSIVHPPSLVH